MYCANCLKDPCMCGGKVPIAKTRYRKQIRTSKGYMDLIYCISCGVNGGCVIPDSPVIYICPKCAETYKDLGIPEVDETFARTGKVKL